MVAEREPYREAGEAAYTQQQKDWVVKRLKRQAKHVGFVLTPQEA
jgi:hypothetical protein